MVRVKHCPLLDHMWNNWKDHWTAAFADMRSINCMIYGDVAFANQAVAQELVQAEKWLHRRTTWQMLSSRRTI
jgi:hypothetical protein